MKQSLKQSIISVMDIYNVHYNNNKYFKDNNEEIWNIDAYIAKIALNMANSYILSDNEIKEIKTHYINKFNAVKAAEMAYEIPVEERITDWWPELPIIKTAKELGPITSNEGAPFQLDDKQYQILNILLYHPKEEVMFITTGVGGSGKSTYLNIIRQLFKDYSSATLSDLTNPFIVAEATKHRLICSDELAKGDIDTKVLKTLISKQPMEINPKNLKPHLVQTQSSLFFCCNKAPKIDVTDSGILRRIIYYERNTKIENPDISLNSKIYTKDELLWFARRALAFENANWRDQFIQETHKYLMSNNTVYLCGMNTVTYQDYREACKNKGYKAYSESNYEEIKVLFKEWIKEVPISERKQAQDKISRDRRKEIFG